MIRAVKPSICLIFAARMVFILMLLFTVVPTFAAINPPREMIIDTDVGIDDVIAILYTLKQPNIKIDAITIESDGVSYCRPAFNNIQGLLMLMGKTWIPTACGRSAPLTGNHHFPDAILQANSKLDGAALKKPSLFLPNISAKTLMIQTLQTAAQPVDILAIGPLTTLAEVLSEHHELQKKIRHIYFMGGALFHPGNITSVDPSSINNVAEWNIYIDPLAASQVFHSGIPITLVPLDVTNQVLIDNNFYQQLKTKQNKPEVALIRDILEHNKKALTDHTWYFWDPMAAVIAANEDIATCNILPIAVRLEPESQSGQVVVDKKEGVPMQVCLMIDSDKFKNTLLAVLNS